MTMPTRRQRDEGDSPAADRSRPARQRIAGSHTTEEARATEPDRLRVHVSELADELGELYAARKSPHERSGAIPAWKRIGPGLITGAADDDPSGIGTYSVAGAQYGLQLLWLAPYVLPLMVAVQEMCGRVGAVTGMGLAALLKKHYPRWLLWTALLLLFGANTINVWADLNAMAASEQMLFGLPFMYWLTVTTALLLVTQVFIPYRTYVRVLKWLCLTLLAYFVTAVLPQTHADWGAVSRHLVVPTWRWQPAFIMTVVAFLGTTISPYLFFWQAGETIEEEVVEGVATQPGQRTTHVTEAELRTVRADTLIGMIASQAVAVFVLVCTASTLHRWHHTDINTAQDAAKALLPLGPAAYWLFALGMIGTGLLAIPTLAGSAAYAAAEAFDWRYGLYRRFQHARAFYLTISAVVLTGYLLNFVHSFSPIKGLFYCAVINGMVAPPLIAILLFICNNRRIVGDRCNGRTSNVLGWTAVILMSTAALYMVYGMATGQGG